MWNLLVEVGGTSRVGTGLGHRDNDNDDIKDAVLLRKKGKNLKQEVGVSDSISPADLGPLLSRITLCFLQYSSPLVFSALGSFLKDAPGQKR